MDARDNKNLTTEENKNIETTRGGWFISPAADIYETENDYKMIFDIPGVEKENINLNVEKDVLTLTAECFKEPGKDYSLIRSEMEYTGYKRSFDLNNVVNSDQIKADYHDGTLILVLPKKEEQKTREIKINVN